MNDTITVKARLRRLVIILVIAMTVINGTIAVLFSLSSIKKTYRYAAETATYHLKAALENGEDSWEYDEETGTVTCAGREITLSLLSTIIETDSTICHTIFWDDTRVLTNLKNSDGSYATGTQASESIYASVKAGNTYTKNGVTILGSKYTVCYVPIYNDGKFCGMLFTGISQDNVNTAVGNLVFFNILSSIVLIIVFMIIANKILNEISDNLSKKLNEGYINLGQFAGDVQNVASRTNKEVGEITTAMDSVANGATSQAAATEQAMASTEEFSASIDVVNNEITDSYNFIDTIKSCVEESQASIDELNDSIDNNNRIVDVISIDIENGVESSRKAGSIVKTIDNLAFQINLLALNASVEASHAGEFGRGFAVVANEIKSLASSSAKSAGDTADIIAAIVETMNKTQDSNEKLIEANKMQLEKAEIVYNKMLSLKEYIEQLVSKLDHIKENSDSLNIVKGELIEVIQSLSSTSEDNAAVCEEVCASTETVSTNIDNLSSSIGKIDSICDDMKAIIEYFG